MQPHELSQLLDVSPQTIRRWTRVFRRYLTPHAVPQKGKARRLAPHDVRIMRLVAEARKENQPQEMIESTLDALQADNWRGLPETPAEWERRGDTITLPEAAARAWDAAQFAALQKDLEQARGALDVARNRVTELESALESATEAGQEKDTRYHSLELELERARGQVAELQARLSSYALGRDRPVNVGLIILAALAAGAALVLIAVLVMALVM